MIPRGKSNIISSIRNSNHLRQQRQTTEKQTIMTKQDKVNQKYAFNSGNCGVANTSEKPVKNITISAY